MPHTATLRRSTAPSVEAEASSATQDQVSSSPWLTVVADRVKTMRYGVVQIVVHDSKVVQIERTERTRFDVPHSANGQ